MILEIVIVDANPTAKAKVWIESRVSQGVCLCCDKPSAKRGLCMNCYYGWRSKRKQLGLKKEMAVYDARLIRIGKLLMPHSVIAIKRQSVFDRAAEEVGS